MEIIVELLYARHYDDLDPLTKVRSRQAAMDYNVFMRRQLAQDQRMNTLMLEQIYCNLDGRAYDSDDLEYTGEQLIDRAMTQAADYYDIAGGQGEVRREIGAMLSAAAPVSGAD